MTVATVGAGGLFGWNALTQQTNRHPAPLFAGAKTEIARAEPPRRPEPAPAPLPTPRPDTHLASMQTGGITPSARSPGGDAIGALLRSSGEAAPRAAEPTPAKADPKVAAAQKALTKLGYGPLKADGILGATTRNAVLRFEREKKLPTTGAVAGQTVKRLAALSGLPIE